MKHTWDLTILYNGFDDPAVASDTKELEKAISELGALA